jgi:transposase
MDNLRAHRTSKTQKIMEKIKFLFNASYTPEFNPIEYIFNQLKRMVRYEISGSIDDLIIRIINKLK